MLEFNLSCLQTDTVKSRHSQIRNSAPGVGRGGGGGLRFQKLMIPTAKQSGSGECQTKGEASTSN